jgi:hypothetical protein
MLKTDLRLKNTKRAGNRSFSAVSLNPFEPGAL